MAPEKTRRHLALGLLIVHLAACSSMQTVAIRDVQIGGENSPVFPGDRVEVVTTKTRSWNSR